MARLALFPSTAGRRSGAGRRSLPATRPALLLGLLLLLGASGCGMNDEKAILMAAGGYGDIAIALSDEALRPATERFLGVFNPEVTFVIQPESTYSVDVFGPDTWETARGYKNAVLLVRMGSGNAVEKQAKRLISSEAWKTMEASGGGIVQVPDPWSTYQLAVIVVGRDVNGISSILRNSTEKLRKIIDDSNRERILRRQRHDGLHTALMDRYWRDLGFWLEIPGDFGQNQFRPDGFPGLELMTTAPSRGITISWRETPEPTAFLADADVMVAIRSEMGQALHKEELVPESFVWSRDTIGDVACVKLEGAWNSTDFTGGGPFRCWFIPDRERGRLYCVDLLVYAPGQEKMPHFRRLETVLSTFSLKGPKS
ncbi:MAG: DUF4837 family protein [bacterium]|nr:DUF4837 family protein [bacterium]